MDWLDMIGKLLDAITADRNASPGEGDRSRRLLVITFAAVSAAVIIVLGLVASFGRSS